MYMSHLELISSMPESFDEDEETEPESAEDIAAAVADEHEAAKAIKGAYESRFNEAAK